MRTSLAVLALLLLLVPVPARGDRETKDRIAEFERNFGAGMSLFTRSKAVDGLAEVADPDALKAFRWGFDLTVKTVRERLFEKDDAAAEVKRLEEQIAEHVDAANEQAKREGRPPPRDIPLPASLVQAHAAAREKVERIQKDIDREYEVRALLAAGLGRWLPVLSEEDRAEVLRDVARKGLDARDWATRAFFATTLAGSDLPETARLLLARLAEESDPRVLPVVIDAVAARGLEMAVPDLVGRLEDERWQIRVAAAAALGKIRSPAAVQPLIDRLRVETGRLRGDLADALRAITGQDLGIDPDRWQAWWDAHREGFAPPGKAPEGAPDGGQDGEGGADAKPPESAPPAPPDHGPSFYGIRVVSKRIIFVIDVSGSMNEPVRGDDAERTKIAVAKYELKNALLALPEDAKFNLVTYSFEVAQWRKGMVKATGKVKRAAVKHVDEIEAVGGTNVHDALKQAFHIVGMGARDKNYELGADTIFFLSDGKPTVGEIIDPNQILAEVKRWNELRRVKIHTVGVGADHDAAFMRALADSSGGTYVSR